MKFSNKGFSMIELLVVLLIIATLSAVAAPMYLVHAEKAKTSEAVGVVSLARQAEREHYVLHNAFLPVAAGNIENDPNASSNKGLGVIIGATQYFSKDCYSVSTGTNFTDGTAAVDFLLKVNGSASAALSGNSGARNYADVSAYRVEMDNSGRTVYSTDSGTTWRSF